MFLENVFFEKKKEMMPNKSTQICRQLAHLYLEQFVFQSEMRVYVKQKAGSFRRNALQESWKVPRFSFCSNKEKQSR